jgi:hypothetical protein
MYRGAQTIELNFNKLKPQERGKEQNKIEITIKSTEEYKRNCLVFIGRNIDFVILKTLQ